MPWLAARKRAVNATLQSPALRADIVESATCAYLAAVTLVGLVISALTGWWWIQYLAALALLWWLIPEAREAFKAGREINGDAEHDS
jgi:divalent metal cation (Fe/Co/Zn/Cd) transporter